MRLWKRKTFLLDVEEVYVEYPGFCMGHFFLSHNMRFP